MEGADVKDVDKKNDDIERCTLTSSSVSTVSTATFSFPSSILKELPADLLADIRGHVRLVEVEEKEVKEKNDTVDSADGSGSGIGGDVIKDRQFEQQMFPPSSSSSSFLIKSSRYTQFPLHLRERLGYTPCVIRTDTGSSSGGASMVDVCYVRGDTQHLSQSLSKIVSRAATAQTIKGLFTAGLIKSTKYVFQKVLKRFK